MKILRKITTAQKLTASLKLKRKTVGFVPTMGYLHEGHISLVKAAKKKADVVIVSIFVNPLQFGPKEDFARYPRNFKRDEKLCRDAGVDYILYPDVKEMYPKGFSTFVDTEVITSFLEGKIRPGHFKGVTTVVLKLFNIVQADFSVFGQKDAQQSAVIKKMVTDLNIFTKIIVSPTVREKDGLAMSSRNVYLTTEQRVDAAYLYKALGYAKRKILLDNYNKDIDFLRGQMSKLIKSRKTATKIDYISFNDNETLEELKTLKTSGNNGILISLAVRFGKVRLIDNIVIKR
ncbi:MAG: pantoate--beta-alanine ligase [Ignavibacteria bacterium]